MSFSDKVNNAITVLKNEQRQLEAQRDAEYEKHRSNTITFLKRLQIYDERMFVGKNVAFYPCLSYCNEPMNLCMSFDFNTTPYVISLEIKPRFVKGCRDKFERTTNMFNYVYDFTKETLLYENDTPKLITEIADYVRRNDITLVS